MRQYAKMARKIKTKSSGRKKDQEEELIAFIIKSIKEVEP